MTQWQLIQSDLLVVPASEALEEDGSNHEDTEDDPAVDEEGRPATYSIAATDQRRGGGAGGVVGGGVGCVEERRHGGLLRGLDMCVGWFKCLSCVWWVLGNWSCAPGFWWVGDGYVREGERECENERGFGLLLMFYYDALCLMFGKHKEDPCAASIGKTGLSLMASPSSRG